MGFRQLLNRAAEVEPRRELAEPADTPTGRFAPRTTQSDAEGMSLAFVEKTASLGSAAESRTTDRTEGLGPKVERRRPPSYQWRSQRYRNCIFDMKF